MQGFLSGSANRNRSTPFTICVSNVEFTNSMFNTSTLKWHLFTILIVSDDADLRWCLPVGQFQDHISQFGTSAFVLAGIDADGIFNGSGNGAGAVGRSVDMAVQRCNQQVLARPIFNKPSDAETSYRQAVVQNIQRSLMRRRMGDKDKRSVN